MPSLPVRKDHYSWPRLPNCPRNFETVLPGVLDAAVRDVERLAPGNFQNSRSFGGFRFARLCRSSRAHFAASEIKNAGAFSLLCCLQQCATAGLLHVVTVRGNGQDVEIRRRHQSRFPCSIVTFSRTISRWAAISFSLGRTRLT